MRAVSRSLSATMMPRYCRRFSSLATRPERSISPNMRTSESGVFSSWETLATKSLLRAARRRSLTEAVTTMTTPAIATSAARHTMPISITRCRSTYGPRCSAEVSAACTRQL